MIVAFDGIGAENVFNGRDTRRARQSCPASIWTVARRKLDMLDSAAVLNDLAVPPVNRLERLAGDRSGQYSMRINEQYRICFLWTDAGPDQVEITDYH